MDNKRLTPEEIEALDAPEFFKQLAQMPGYGMFQQQFKPGCSLDTKPKVYYASYIQKGRAKLQGNFDG